jgi:hypothetical protein
MEIGSYRMRAKKIALPQDGMVPAIPDGIAPREQEALRDWITRLSRSAEFVNIMSQRRIDSGSVATRAETSLAWKKWILSHHLFIPMLTLTGHALSIAAESMRSGKRQVARKAVEAASRMRRGCGALFMYSVDFQPCAEIYGSQIRNQMPPAFSGYEIRERQNSYQPAVAMFNSEYSKNDTDSFVKEMRSMWVAADMRYHELHERCMVQAVAPNVNKANGEQPSRPESLRAAHRRQYGEVPPLSEENYQEYDRWFAIERRDDVTWFDYVYEVCEVIERLLADLLVGHRLEPAVVNELVESTQAVLALFVEQVKTSTDTFTLCPQQLRGSECAELHDGGSHS